MKIERIDPPVAATPVPGTRWKAGVVGLLAVAALGLGGVYLYAPQYLPSALQGATKNTRGGRAGTNPDAPVPVLASAATKQDVPVYFDGVGSSRALNIVTVRAQVDGKLIAVNFKEGQDVEKGFVLADIDPTIYRAQLDQAVAKKAMDEALLGNARIDLDRYAKLTATNSASRQQYDTQKALVAQLEAQVQADQGAIENAKAMLSYTRIVAPIAGRTGLRLIDAGNIVHATDTTGVVVITQIRPIAILFTLPQQELPAVNRAFAKGALDVAGAGRRQPHRGRSRQARRRRQPGRPDDRHGEAQGGVSQPGLAALAGAVRQREAPGRHAQGRDRGADRIRPARPERDLRLRRERRQHGLGAAGQRFPAGRRPRGARRRASTPASAW